MGSMEKAVRSNAVVLVWVVIMLTGFVTKGVAQAGRASIVEKARYILIKNMKNEFKTYHEIILISEFPFNFKIRRIQLKCKELNCLFIDWSSIWQK